jgi:hypothetical protein
MSSDERRQALEESRRLRRRREARNQPSESAARSQDQSAEDSRINEDDDWSSVDEEDVDMDDDEDDNSPERGQQAERQISARATVVSIRIPNGPFDPATTETPAELKKFNGVKKLVILLNGNELSSDMTVHQAVQLFGNQSAAQQGPSAHGGSPMLASLLGLGLGRSIELTFGFMLGDNLIIVNYLSSGID